MAHLGLALGRRGPVGNAVSRGSGGEVEAVAAPPTNDAGVVHGRDCVEDGGDAPAVNRPRQDVREVREVPGNTVGHQGRRKEGYSGGGLRVDLARLWRGFIFVSLTESERGRRRGGWSALGVCGSWWREQRVRGGLYAREHLGLPRAVGMGGARCRAEGSGGPGASKQARRRAKNVSSGGTVEGGSGSGGAAGEEAVPLLSAIPRSPLLSSSSLSLVKH